MSELNDIDDPEGYWCPMCGWIPLDEMEKIVHKPHPAKESDSD